ncbi:hypothetical protein RM190_13590 [Paracoccus sp. CPCC 101403]|uniref:Uncharacterized protein n=1 Tax=Paracoccus broussonetiae TaxID=3075834 RepID=A0ABU3EF89_9RHOB|nr:hypothetical protein [Paracoccus sp. CPCC 101403]MDT1062906.1 hypothetical protein [Paracoccus sp. CPCC 101403]
MIGVVLWSSAPREKAIIWCEDHAALAYLQGRANLTSKGDWPESGDLVELDYETEGELRHARRVEVVSGYRRSDLSHLLREAGQGATAQPVLRVISNDKIRGPEPQPRKVAAAG